MQTSQFQRKKIAQKIALKQLLMLHVKRLDVRTAATVVSCWQKHCGIHIFRTPYSIEHQNWGSH